MNDVIEVFCDGSVTNAVMLDPLTSHIGDEYVGRAMVVIPALDFGLIEQTRAGMVTDRGNPASTQAETFAIRTALAACAQLGLTEYMIFADCQGAIASIGSDRVEWRSREQMYLPNSFFDKVLGRAGYLRTSSRTVKKRKPVAPHQIEAFELFQAARREFKLSASALWVRVARDAQRHELALGLGKPAAAAPGATPHGGPGAASGADAPEQVGERLPHPPAEGGLNARARRKARRAAERVTEEGAASGVPEDATQRGQPG